MSTAPAPGSEEWSAKVTASKVAAILSLSPWESQYSMWRKMRNEIPWGEESRPMQRGNMLEDGVLNWWLKDNPDHVDIGRQVYMDLGDWAGATPDMYVRSASGEIEAVDAKTTGRDDDWHDGPPAYYIVSSLFQMACDPDVKRVHLATLFGSPFDLRTFTVERDDDLIASIVTRCREFYDSLALDEAPDLDDSVATYEAVRALHPDIEPKGSEREEVEVDRATAHEFVTANLDLKEAETRERAAKTALLDAMGRARIATCDGVTVARRQPNKYGVSLVRVAAHIDPPTDQETSA